MTSWISSKMRSTWGGHLDGYQTGLGFPVQVVVPMRTFIYLVLVCGHQFPHHSKIIKENWINDAGIVAEMWFLPPVRLWESVSWSGLLGTDRAGSAEPGGCLCSWTPSETHAHKKKISQVQVQPLLILVPMRQQLFYDLSLFIMF